MSPIDKYLSSAANTIVINTLRNCYECPKLYSIKQQKFSQLLQHEMYNNEDDNCKEISQKYSPLFKGIDK